MWKVYETENLFNGFFKGLPYVYTKAEKKGRTKEEVDKIICWLTGYDEDAMKAQIEKEADIETFLPKPRK